MHYNADEICQIVEGRKIVDKAKDGIKYLALDSRQIPHPQESLFIAIKGFRHDGHHYVKEAYHKGVKLFLVERNHQNWLNLPGLTVILVDNTVKALQKLSQHHRQQFNLPVIGITGSNAKTIIKEWLFQLLTPDFNLVRSPRSYNSQIGVPLSVMQINQEHQLAIFEAGISTSGEMEQLSSIIQCKLGLFTNLGAAHDEGFATRVEKLQEKLLLFKHAQTIFYCKDQKDVHQAIQQRNQDTFSWSLKQDADLKIQQIDKQHSFTHIMGTYRDQSYTIKIPFLNDAAIENAIHCWAILLYLNIPPQIIQDRMVKLQHVSMRLEIKEGINDCTIINDTYSNDFDALREALKLQSQHAPDKTQVAILSDFYQTGVSQEEFYKNLAQLIRSHEVEEIIGIGQAIRDLQFHLPSSMKQTYYPDTQTCIHKHLFYKYQSASILIKGARSFGFERLTNLLTKQVHEAVLEVSLSAIVHNLTTYQSLLKKSTKIMVMVKAAAYGSGSTEIARILEFNQVAYLAVAYADEGIELRKAGIQTPIMVLNPSPSVFASMLTYRLEPEIYSLEQLLALKEFLGTSTAPYPIHINLDTGMHRLGFNATNLEELINFLKQHPSFIVKSVFSHLAASDDPQHDAYTKQQYEQFLFESQRIINGLEIPILRHILNSNGISRFPQYQLDMVRLGIGLYGLDTSNSLSSPLRPVVNLKATISQIKQVPEGASIGYGRRGIKPEARRIATVNIGYADGLPRSAGNGQYALLLHEQKAPIVGSVCMDMCMIDVSHISQAKVGDTVLIFGEELPIDELTKVEGTIPYEILTRVSSRVKRVYIRD